MKTIIVNSTESTSLEPLKAQDIRVLIQKICDYLLTIPVRNQKMLCKKKELTVVFLSANEMKKINRQFRKKNSATDILSFVSGDPKSLGELLLCLDVLKKQSKRQKHPLKNEVTYMLIHGILHLLGYDHEISSKEEKLMFKLQDRCFEAFDYQSRPDHKLFKKPTTV